MHTGVWGKQNPLRHGVIVPHMQANIKDDQVTLLQFALYEEFVSVNPSFYGDIHVG